MKHGVLILAAVAAVTLSLFSPDLDARPVRRVVVAPPSAVYVVPGFTDLYYYRVGATDVFFAHGVWWTMANGVWYQAANYSGPWFVVAPAYVPFWTSRLPYKWHNRYYSWDRVRWNSAYGRRHYAPAPARHYDRPAMHYHKRAPNRPAYESNRAPQRNAPAAKTHRRATDGRRVSWNRAYR